MSERKMFFIHLSDENKRKKLQNYRRNGVKSKTRDFSQCRQNYNEESEAAVNKQINIELTASYNYQAMAIHFDKDEVALPGFRDYFQHSCKEEWQHALALMKFQNQRGGQVLFSDIKSPSKTTWSSGLEAMEAALQLEKSVNQNLLELHQIAKMHNDPNLCSFIEGQFLAEQVEAIKTISAFISNLKRKGSGIDEFLFCEDIFKKAKKF